jgi:two-component system cell cycle sensor histidine kinase/response regulator CckA
MGPVPERPHNPAEGRGDQPAPRPFEPRPDQLIPSAEEHWRALVDGVPDFIFSVGLDGIIAESNRTRADPGMADPVGKAVFDMAASPVEREAVRALLARVRLTGKMEVFESSAAGDKGEVVHYESRCIPVVRAGQVVSFLVVTRDVSANVAARRELAGSEERWRALIEHSGDAISLTDATGRMLYASPSTTHVLGYRPEELVGTELRALVHPDDQPMARAERERLLSRPGRSTVVPPFRMRHHDGTWRWVEAVWSNLLEVPSVAALVSNYRDVTARVRLEEQLRQSQKMEAIGLLAGGVAHDFNNLLTVIIGFAESAALSLSADHSAAEDLVKVTEAARSAADLTSKLLAFSRRQILRFEVFDVRDLLRSFGGLLERIVGEDVVVEIVEPDEPVPVEGDPVQLQQVLLNLSTNARQAMPSGGKLRIELQRTQVPPEGSAGPARERCTLTVSDTGIGMEEATRTRAFEPFFTTRPGGTGLGLSVVFGVVRGHRGSIEIESARGVGTTVRVELPLHGSAIKRRLTPSPTVEPGGTETLLLAEDEPPVRELVARILRRLGYEVLVAADGEEAAAVFAREADRIALVVLDVIMPRLGGQQALARMRALRPELKALFVSGYAPEATGIGDLLAGGRTAVVHKPFLAVELATKVRHLLDR